MEQMLILHQNKQNSVPIAYSVIGTVDGTDYSFGNFMPSTPFTNLPSIRIFFFSTVG